ncbi:MAG: hypothetical protein HC929_18915 [Leptolyngbyaceae cyanobacterium SM2_5_2]|nr:hypothetical protein [Leptolyngbyaceae cyanobacterium SM2_5_2]
MSFQRYPLPTVQKLSQLIRDALVLPTTDYQPGNAELADDNDTIPDSLDALGDLFRVGDVPEDHLVAPNTEGRWFLSTIDPAAALTKLPNLWISPGIRLITYLKQDSTGGLGNTVALPGLLSTTERLEAAIETLDNADQPPNPMGALPNLMAGIEGDGSLPSFLTASIFIRELKEFGRFGRYTRWAHHRFVAAAPPQIPWQWRTKMPEDFSPKVVLRQDSEVLVEFYSCRVQKPVALFRHLDRYPPNSYTASNQDQVIAVAGATTPA